MPPAASMRYAEWSVMSHEIFEPVPSESVPAVANLPFFARANVAPSSAREYVTESASNAVAPPPVMRSVPVPVNPAGMVWANPAVLKTAGAPVIESDRVLE